MPTICSRVFSLLLPVFILNLCILVPIPKAEQSSSFIENGQQVPLKRNNRFLLEIAFDGMTGCSTKLPDNTGSSLLEELNEVKEDWHHNVPIQLYFEGYYTENIHGTLTAPLFPFLRDSRFSPPPEYVS